ncbi:MAG: flagellar hook-length control protein FliK [Candidatus Kapabacteria bacterium]|nr:flagellar hook-length control protein FliK [Candidatus Kapabacteria bacterium]
MIDLAKNKASQSKDVFESLNKFNNIQKDTGSKNKDDYSFSSLITLSDKNLQKLKGKFKEENVSINSPFEEVPFENFKSFINGLLSAGDLDNTNFDTAFNTSNNSTQFGFLANDMAKNIDQLENIKQKISEFGSGQIISFDDLSIGDLKTLEANNITLNLKPKTNGLEKADLNLDNLNIKDLLIKSNEGNNLLSKEDINLLKNVSDKLNLSEKLSIKDLIVKSNELSDLISKEDINFLKKVSDKLNLEESNFDDLTLDSSKMGDTLILENQTLGLNNNVSSTINILDNLSKVDFNKIEINLTNSNTISDLKGNKVTLSDKTISAIDSLDEFVNEETASNKSVGFNNSSSDNSIKPITNTKTNKLSDIVMFKDAYIKIEKNTKHTNQDIQPQQIYTNDGLKLNNFLINQNVKINDKTTSDNNFIFNDTGNEIVSQHFELQKETNLENDSNGKSNNFFDFSKKETLVEDNILKTQVDLVGQSKFKTEFFKAEMKEIPARSFSNVNPNEINAPILKTINDMHGDGSTVANLILNPANLGMIRVEIAIKDNVAKIKINAESADVAKTIEAQLPALKDKLAESGIKTDNLDLNYNKKESESSDHFAQNQQNAKQEEGEVRKKYLEFMKRLGELEKGFSEKFGYDPEPSKIKV